LRTRFGVGQDPGVRAHDRNAEAVERPGKVRGTDVDAASRRAHPVDLVDDLLAVGSVLQVHADRALAAVLDHAEVAHEAGPLQRLHDAELRPGIGNVDLRQADPVRVPDPREEVGDGIGLAHARLPARLAHAGDLAALGELPEADPADAELLIEAARAPAEAAA